MNNKSRASGSGTTSQARRERRQGVQWTSLSHADHPCTSSESLEEKLEALKKAQASAEEQLKRKKKDEEDEKAALKKAEENLEALTKRGKNGPRSRSQSRARLSTAEEAAKEHALRDRLTKQLAQLKLETDPSSLKKDSSLKKGQFLLQKGKGGCLILCLILQKDHLEKGKERLQKGGGGGLAQHP